MGHIITANQTCVHHVTPEIRVDSMTWKNPSSSTAPNLKVQQSTKKLIATMFWNANVVAQCQRVNSFRYCETIDRLRKNVRRKRPELCVKISCCCTTTPPSTRSIWQYRVGIYYHIHHTVLTWFLQITLLLQRCKGGSTYFMPSLSSRLFVHSCISRTNVSISMDGNDLGK